MVNYEPEIMCFAAGPPLLSRGLSSGSTTNAWTYNKHQPLFDALNAHVPNAIIVIANVRNVERKRKPEER